MAVLSAPEKLHKPRPRHSAGHPTDSAHLQPSNPLGGISPKTHTALNWLIVAVCVYLLITAVNVIGSGFALTAGDQAAQLFDFASKQYVLVEQQDNHFAGH